VETGTPYDTLWDHFGTHLDRTLSQPERAQRMRLGQQVLPRIDVSLSSQVFPAPRWVDWVNSVEGYAPRRVLVLGVLPKNAKLQNELAQLLLILSIDRKAFAPANWWFALGGYGQAATGVERPAVL
jgi:hypothetical protein